MTVLNNGSITKYIIKVLNTNKFYNALSQYMNEHRKNKFNKTFQQKVAVITYKYRAYTNLNCFLTKHVTDFLILKFL